MLMVGTLQCRRSHQASIDLYNDFVTSQRGVLDANSNVLKSHFMRENGISQGQHAYDRFGTSLANQYSAQLDDPEFCETVHHFARLAARATTDELLELADAVAEAPRGGVCRPSQYRFEHPRYDDGRDDHAARREPLPPPRVLISDGTEVAVAATPAIVQEAAAAAEAAPAAVNVATIEPAPAPAVAEVSGAPAPLPVEAKLELIEQVKAEPAVAPAPAAPRRDEALQAAIAALQSAVVALQAASAPEAGEPGPVKAVELPSGGTSE